MRRLVVALVAILGFIAVNAAPQRHNPRHDVDSPAARMYSSPDTTGGSKIKRARINSHVGSLARSLSSSQPGVFDVIDFGAKPDATTDNTKPFTDALTACNKAGGGEVFVGTGHWLFQGT